MTVLLGNGYTIMLVYHIHGVVVTCKFVYKLPWGGIYGKYTQENNR